MDEDVLLASAWAQALGMHALLVFGAALLVLLAAATGAWAVWRHVGARPLAAVAQVPAVAWLGLRLVAGLATVLAAAALFAEMLEWSDADDALGVFDTALARTLSQWMPPGALRGFGWITRLGDPPWLTAVVLVVGAWLLWRGQRRLALAWVAAGAGNGILNHGLKQVFARVRPVHEHGFAVADGFSFPSGHTSGAVAVYGMLAVLVLRLAPPRWQLPALLALVALVFAIGCSRVLLQVHWASDVLAGFASGLAWLTVCVLASRRWP